MEILNLVDKLETYLSSSARFPGTHKLMLDSDKMLEMVDLMRLSIPKDIQESKELLAKREAIVNQALLDARRIKASAEEESRSQMVESVIFKEAENKAEELLSDAKRRADALMQDSQRSAHETTQEAMSFHDTRVLDSNRYAQETLSRLEQQLAMVMNSVRMGLDALDESRKVGIN